MASILKKTHLSTTYFTTGLVFLLTLSTLLLYPPSYTNAAEQAPEDQVDGSAEVDTSTSPIPRMQPIQTEGIDQAGEKISQGIDQIERWAAQHLGNWIAHNALAGITWLKLLFCMVLLLLVMVFERVIRWFLQVKINSITGEKEHSWYRLLLNALMKPLSLFIWVYGIYSAFSPLYGHFETADGKNTVQFIVAKATDVGGTIALFWFLYLLVNLLDSRLRRWTAKSQNTVDDMLAPLVGKTLRVFIFVIGSIMVLQNLTGVQVGPLVASLGIGGLAIAFASKDSIANFFGTLTILFDKPFQVGDRIVIDSFDGVVESVGFRSTRIRTLTGHLVTIPNDKVVNTGLENIGKRPYLRWYTNIGITYDTPVDKVNKAVSIVRNALDNHEGMNPEFPPRVYFNGFNDWNLNIVVFAWFHPPDYWQFQEWVQNICLRIMEGFKAADIDFAFPSQTLYLANENKRQLKMELTIEDIQKKSLNRESE